MIAIIKKHLSINFLEMNYQKRVNIVTLSKVKYRQVVQYVKTSNHSA